MSYYVYRPIHSRSKPHRPTKLKAGVLVDRSVCLPTYSCSKSHRSTELEAEGFVGRSISTSLANQ